MAGFVRYLLAGIGIAVLALTGAMAIGIYTLPIGEIPAINFKTLTLTEKPNQYLVCPPGICTAESQRPSPSYGMSVDELRLRWRHQLSNMPGLSQISTQPDGWQFTYLERSQFMGFPDLITIRFIPTNERTSAIAIYSRSIYGYSDLGVNRDRIENWLAAFAK